MKTILTVLLIVFISYFSFAEDNSYQVTNLKPNHQYVICINGYKEHDSNKTLLKIGECWESTGEGYIDYGTINTDSTGNLTPGLKKDLPTGTYKVKFLLKDPENKWKVIWNVDDIEFSVK